MAQDFSHFSTTSVHFSGNHCRAKTIQKIMPRGAVIFCISLPGNDFHQNLWFVQKRENCFMDNDDRDPHEFTTARDCNVFLLTIPLVEIRMDSQLSALTPEDSWKQMRRGLAPTCLDVCKNYHCQLVFGTETRNALILHLWCMGNMSLDQERFG